VAIVVALAVLGLCGLLGILVSFALAKHCLKEIDRMGDRLRASDPLALAALRRSDGNPVAPEPEPAPSRSITLETMLGDSGG
jgi:hypothetical protein